MNETTIARVCLAITIIGMLIFAATYKEEFEEKTITELLSEEGQKGIITARVEYVIKNYPVTIFAVNDGNKTTIYYPKAITIEKNNFVKVYAESQRDGKHITLFAHKVIKE